MATIVGFGACHRDVVGRLSAPAEAASVPGRTTTYRGGAAFNVLRHVAAAGHPSMLVTPHLPPSPPEGLTVASLGEPSGEEPSYTAILDESGELIVALSDMEAYERIRTEQMDEWAGALRDANRVLVDANLPEAVIGRARSLRDGGPIDALCVSPSKAVRLVPLQGAIGTLFANTREAVALCGHESDASTLARSLVEWGCRQAVVTDGPRACGVADADNVWSLDAPRVNDLRDVTGAGDAVAGGTLAALEDGVPLPEAVKRGLALAGQVVTVDGPALPLAA